MRKLLLFFAFLAVGFSPFAYRYFKKPAPPQVSYIPKTWSSFDQFPRLEMLLRGFSIKTMLDFPSTDIEAFKKEGIQLKSYVGVCKTKDDAIALQARFGSSERSFYYLDPAIDPLPKVDLIFAWDQFNTMKRSSVIASLLHIKKSGSKFLLLAHDPTVEKNASNKTGEYMPINWRLGPYHFPDPMITFGNLALWSIDSI